MPNPYYPSEVIPCTIQEFLKALGFAWQNMFKGAIPPQVARLLCAHWGLETGFGSNMFCYNAGNVRAYPGWEGGVTFIQGNELNPDGSLKYWFDFTPSDKNRFRAYPVLQEGIDDYLQVKRNRRGWDVVFSGDPAAYAQMLYDTKYFTADLPAYRSGLQGCFKQVAGVAIPPAERVEVRRLVPSECDPTQDPDYEPELYHPYPALGKDNWKAPYHCSDCKGLYAVHAGYKIGKDPIRPDVLEGFPCSGRRDLANAKVSTVFSGDKLRHYDWKTSSFLQGEYTLKELGLPDEIRSIDAACPNPVDWNVVWLFSGSKVVDFSVSKRRPLRRGRVAGGKIDTEVAVEIKDHPVFGVLGIEFHDGIKSAFVGHPKVSLFAGRSYEMMNADPAAKTPLSWFFPLANVLPAEYVGMPFPKDEARRIFVKSARAVATLLVTSMNRAWPFAATNNTLPTNVKPTKIINGAGPMAEYVFSFDDGPKCKVTRWKPEQDTKEEEWDKLFHGFKPDAAVPVKILPKEPPKIIATPGVKPQDDQVPPTAPSATVNLSTLDPPDILIAIWGRGALPKAPDATSSYLKGLVADVDVRHDALVKRVVDDKDVPDFLRAFVPVHLSQKVWTSSTTFAFYEVVYFVAPDWLSIGSDFEWCRVPLPAPRGQRVMDTYGCVYPTSRMAKQIYEAAPKRPADLVVPFDELKGTLKALGGKTSTEAFMAHHTHIESRRSAPVLGRLFAGAKRDVVAGKDSQKHILFWGGVDQKGDPAANTASNPVNDYTEHAMGLRLVCQILYIKKAGGTWEQKLVETLLKEPILYQLISSESGVSPKYPAPAP